MPTPVDSIQRTTTIDAGLPPQKLALDKEPDVKSTPAFWNQSSLSSAAPEVEPAVQPKKGFFSSISSAISDFFTSAISWAWGTSPAKVMPGDQKIEGGTVEGIASRPNLSKPEVKNLENYLDITRRMHGRIRSIHEESEGEMKSEQLDPKNYNELHLIAWYVIILKDMKKNNENSVIILNDRLKALQGSIESLQKDKRANLDAAQSFNTILNVTGKLGYVGMALTAAGFIAVGAIVLTSGVAAIPVGLAIAQGMVGGLTAFNKLADNIVSSKLKMNQGESAKLNFKQDQAMFQRKLTYNDIKLAIESAYKAEKTMLEQAQKQHEAHNNIL